MSKRQTKAEVILLEARQRLVDARDAMTDAESKLNAARAAVTAHQLAYDALEKALAPKPRKKPDKPGPDAQKDLPVDKPVLCDACGNLADYQDHFKPSPNYHEFQAPKSKKAAK